MNLTRILSLALLMPCLVLADSKGPSANLNGEPVSRQVREFYARWNSDFEKKDLNRLMRHYDRNVRFSMQGQPDQNYEQLRAGFAADFQARGNMGRWRPNIEKIYSEGRLIVVIGVWDYLDELPGGKLGVVYRIRSVDLLSPSPDGLKIVHTVNYPLETS